MAKKNSFDISELLSFEKSKVKGWLDKLRFSHILLVWLAMVTLYGFAYYFLTSDSNYLFNAVYKVPVHNLWESLYFSFVTATTTGFGDIIPMRSFKIISIAEVVTGLLLLAIVTSKFVSIKQDQIMSELFDISINEKISRLRSSLFLYKQHLNSLLTHAVDGKFRTSDLKNLGLYLRNYEDVLVETTTLISKETSESKHIVKLDFDSLARSVIGAAIRTHEAGLLFTAKGISWRRANKEAVEVISDMNITLGKQFRKLEGISNLNKRLLSSSFKNASDYLVEIISEQENL